jgi:hypothetical protein
MSIIEKLSDRNGLIYEAITMIMVHTGPASPPKLQWELFKCGIYIKQPLLLQAMSVMKEKGMIGRPDEKETSSETPASKAD